jgi:parvulin-like peptidyl-prolyl isomerase
LEIIVSQPTDQRAQSPPPRLTIAQRIALCLIPLIFVSACNKSHNDTTDILASVGNTVITKSSYEKRYLNLTQLQGLPHSEDFRNQLLEEMVDEQVLLASALGEEFETQPIAKQRNQLIKQAVLLDHYTQQSIYPSITISRIELETLYIRLQTTVTVRHLFAQTFAEAELLQNRLRNGESFNDLAAEIFTDPELRTNGGLLEPFTVDEMDPAFEEAAFTLPLNKPSEPIQLKHGYSIIEVLDRTRPPLLTEQQFLEKATNLEAYLRNRKRPQIAQQHADSLRNHVLQIQFVDEVLTDFYTQWRRSTAAEGQTLPVLQTQLPQELATRQLLTQAMGGFSVQQAVDLLDSATENELAWVNSSIDLADLISGLLIRDYMLTTSRSYGLDQTAEYRAEVDDEYETWILGQIQDEILATYIIPSDSLQVFYEREMSGLTQPERIALSGLVVNTEAAVTRVENLLQAGSDFGELARTQSIDSSSAARNGQLGLFTKLDLGPEVNGVWELDEGEWLGPVELGNQQYGFFFVEQRFPPIQPKFDEIQSELSDLYKERNRRSILKRFIDSERQALTIRVYSERLHDITMAGVY